jgi:hypothetical protein
MVDSIHYPSFRVIQKIRREREEERERERERERFRMTDVSLRDDGIDMGNVSLVRDGSHIALR